MKFAFLRSVLALAAACVTSALAYAAKGPVLTDVKVYPTDVNLKTKQDYFNI